MESSEKEEIVRLTRSYGGEWGINHTNRLLQLIELIGAGIDYDAEIVWTAAHLHDWGAYTPWALEGVDHVKRSYEVAGDFLTQQNKPGEFIQAVLTCIATHHQGDPNRPIEAILLSDADALDFLGVVGILREFSRYMKDMRKAYLSVLRRKETLPGQLCLDSSRRLASQRISEMEQVLGSFTEETFGCF